MIFFDFSRGGKEVYGGEVACQGSPRPPSHLAVSFGGPPVGGPSHQALSETKDRITVSSHCLTVSSHLIVSSHPGISSHLIVSSHPIGSSHLISLFISPSHRLLSPSYLISSRRPISSHCLIALSHLISPPRLTS